jgi:ankyrin repeat protein
MWEGGLPLHFACKSKAPVEILEILLRHYPEALCIRDSDGMLPLHASCESGSPISSIKMLLDQYPLSASVQDSYGMLPLHYACVSESCDTIKLLVERYPAAQMVSCKAGRCPTAYLRPTSHARSFLLPVHCALENNSSPETICAIIQSNQDFVRQKDGKEMLPIHVACTMKAHPSVIRALLSSYPESIRIKHRNNLPIALACQRKCGVDTIRVFVESDPTIVRETSEYKRLPLHFASIYTNESEEDLDVIRLLIDTYPEGKQQCDYFDRDAHSYLPYRSKATPLFESPAEQKDREERELLESSKRSQRNSAVLETSVTNLLKEIEENKALMTSSDLVIKTQ